MFVATAICSAMLAAALTIAAVRKLSHRADVVESYARVGVSERQLNGLAVILLVGAGGVLLGLRWAPLGVAASAGVVCYFLLAIIAHIRTRAVDNVGTPVVIEALAVLTLTLRVVSLS